MTQQQSVRAKQVFKPGFTDHERRVRSMMIGFGQEVPETPTVGTDKVRITRVRLDLEEVLEFADDAAISVRYQHPQDLIAQVDNLRTLLLSEVPRMEDYQKAVELCTTLVDYLKHSPAIKFGEDGGNVAIAAIPGKKPDLAKMIDACSDLSVVNTGAFVAFGVQMTPMLELTDENNLMKIANGKLDENGKFRKSPTHPVPSYDFALSLQGYDPARDPNLCCPENEPTPSPTAIESAESYKLLPRPTRVAPAAPEPAEPVEPAEPMYTKPQGGHRPPDHDIREAPGGDYIYSGIAVDTLQQMLREGRLVDACYRLAAIQGELGLPKRQVYERTLRATNHNDHGPRGIVFRLGVAPT